MQPKHLRKGTLYSRSFGINQMMGRMRFTQKQQTGHFFESIINFEIQQRAILKSKAYDVYIRETLSCAIQNVLCKHIVYRGFHKKSDQDDQGPMSICRIISQSILFFLNKRKVFESLLRFMPLQDRKNFAVFCHLKRKYQLPI